MKKIILIMIPQTNVYVPPDVQTVRTLNLIAGILTILSLLGALFLTLIFPLFVILIIIDVVILWYIFSKIPNELNNQKYVEAKHDTLIATILAILFAFVLSGILLLIAYLKYDTIIRSVQQYYQQEQLKQQQQTTQ